MYLCEGSEQILQPDWISWTADWDWYKVWLSWKCNRCQYCQLLTATHISICVKVSSFMFF